MDPDPQEGIRPIGIIPIFIIDGTQFIQVPQIKHSESSELYEASATNEAPPMLEDTDISNQPINQCVDFQDPPPVVGLAQGEVMPTEAGDSRMDQEVESPSPYQSNGGHTTQENASLYFSSPYLLSRFLTIDQYNEPLQHEAGIAVSEGRIQPGQNMFLKRVVELIFGIDTLFNAEP